MERGTDSPGDCRVYPEGKRVQPGHVHFIRSIVALLCLMLLLLSFGLLGGNSHAAGQLMKTPTPVFTPTDTPTPSPTATNTPLPTPTATHTPLPTPTATHIPTPTATPIPSPTVIATATPPVKPTATPTAVKPRPTPTAVKTATPAAVHSAPTITTNHSGGGTPPKAPAGQPDQPWGGFAGPFSPYVTGTLVFLGIASTCLVGLVVVRKRLALPPPVNETLPPSGAKPWKRIRGASAFHGNTSMAGEPLPIGEPTLAVVPSAGFMMPGANNASWSAYGGYQQNPAGNPFYVSPQNNESFLMPNRGEQQGFNPNLSPTPTYLAPATEYFPGAFNPGFDAAPGMVGNAMPSPVTGNQQSPFEEPSAVPYLFSASGPVVIPDNSGPGSASAQLRAVLPVRPIARPVRLEKQRLETEHSQPTQAEQDWLDSSSGEMPSLDDPFLRDTLKRYIQKGKLAREQGQG